MLIVLPLQHLVAEGQYTQLESIYNNRSIAPPVLQNPFQSGFEMFLTRGMPEWSYDETGLLATIEPAGQFDIGARENWRLSLVRDVVPGPTSSNPSWLIVMGSYLYFTMYTPSIGVELWRTNGTGPGMELVKDIYPGLQSSSPTYLTLLDSGHLLFSADGVSTNWMIRSDSVRGVCWRVKLEVLMVSLKCDPAVVGVAL